MSGDRDFKALLNEKLAAMARDISELFDQMIEQHESEKRLLKQNSARQQQRLDSPLEKPRVFVHRSDVQILSHCRVEVDPQLYKETALSHIKEEREELSIKQMQEELSIKHVQDELSVKHVPVENHQYIDSPFSFKSDDGEDKLIGLFLSSPHIHSGTDGLQSLRSDEQTHLHSDSVKDMENSGDSTERAIVAPGFENITGHVLSTDTEDSDEWSMEPEVSKSVALKSLFGKSLKRKSSFGSHTRKQKNSVNDKGSEGIFQCAKCLKTFLRNTCSVRNSSESSAYCTSCSAQLKQGNSVRRTTFHKQKKCLMCPVCKKIFTRSYNLNSHMLIHKGERPYSCTVCSKAFKETGHLKAHTRIHTGEKPFSCTVCKKCFRHRTTCERHEKNHQEIRPFRCFQCGADFKQKAHLIRHLVVHSGERPFSSSVTNTLQQKESRDVSYQRTPQETKLENNRFQYT